MPITPFHFGAGAAVKAAMPRHFSFTLFCYAQVVTDLEPGYHMLMHERREHGLMHSFAGATVVAVFCAVTGKPLCQWLLRKWRSLPLEPINRWKNGSAEISWCMAFLTAFVGTYSHVLLDALMHRDLRPFAPFMRGNPLYWHGGPIGIPLLCLALGFVGALVWVMRPKE
jgi:membrane-bound metal-dependent hydrolase YbcI (DUF457 family)